MADKKLTWLEAIKLYPQEVVPPEDNPIPETISEYQTQDLDEVDSGFGILYVGQTTQEGKYLIKKLVNNSDVSDDLTITFANYSNNTSYTDYADAWTNRYTLTYSAFEDLENVY